jgi:hypothetical protein
MGSSHKATQRISPVEARDALLRSGYLLEARIAATLEDSGYYVDANAAYPDPTTGKSRELDVYALGAAQISRDLEFIFPALLIECINNPQPLALLTKEPQIGFMYHEDMKLSGLPVKILLNKKGDEWVSLPDFLHMDKFLHFCKSRVATQFCSFSQTKDSKWIAAHEGSHFDSFQKLCDATAYFVDKQFKNFHPSADDGINIEFYYPVIVLQGDLLDARPTRKTVSMRHASHLVYRRTVIQGTQEESYNIDVVTERFFPDFLDIINDEMKRTVSRIKRRKKEFRRTIQAIGEKTKRMRSPEKIREMMEF